MSARESDGPSGRDVDDLDVPPRSRLFNLAPRGGGTSRVEGLLSYLIRLARAHSVSPREMVKVELGAAAPVIARMKFGAFFGRDAATVEGLGKYANLFAPTLNQLTGRSDLRCLTLLSLADLLPPMGPGLLAGRPKWCSACLADASCAEDMHRPLIWSFGLYRICSRHQLPMQDRCPKCGRTQPLIPRYPDLGRCDHCGATLAITTAIGSCAASELDVWLAAALEDIVGHLAQFDGVATRRRFAEILRGAVDRYADGNQRRFCREVGLADRALKCWFSRDERPSLPQWLTVCHGLDVLPSAFFLEELPTATTLHRVPARLVRRCEPHILSPAERVRIASQLESIISDPSAASPASVVARRLSLGTTAFRYWFPGEYKMIVTKYRVACHAAANRRLEKDRKSLACIIKRMLSNGDYPGMRRVNLELSAHGASLGCSELMAAYREMVRGIVSPHI